MTPKQFAERFMEQALRELRKLSWISRRAAKGAVPPPTAKDGKFPHLLIQLNKALDVQVRSAEQVREVISQVRHRDF